MSHKKDARLIWVNTISGNILYCTHLFSQTLSELSSLLTKLPEDRLVSLFTRQLCNLDHSESLKACLISSLQKLVCANVIRKETMATHLLDCLKIKHSTLIKQVWNIRYFRILIISLKLVSGFQSGPTFSYFLYLVLLFPTFS